MTPHRVKYFAVLLALLPVIYLGASIVSSKHAQIEEYFGKIRHRWEFVSKQYSHDFPPTLVLAVQGGATSTTGVLYRYTPNPPEFRELYRDTGHSSSLNHEPEQALKLVKQFIDKGTKSYPHEKVIVTMGMSGTEFPGKYHLMEGLKQHPKVHKAVLTSDAETAWLSVFDQEGLILISGTGQVTSGRNKEGHYYNHGGFGGPISDYPSATTIVYEYDRCTESIATKVDGQWQYEYPLPLLEKWIGQYSDNTDAFFGYRSQLLTSSNNEAYASRPKDIINYYQEFHSSKSADQNGHGQDYCVNVAVKSAFNHLNAELSAKGNEQFNHLPFALDGSVAGQLWQLMAVENRTTQLDNRKSSLKTDLIIGALRMIREDISAAEFRNIVKR